MKPIEKQTTEDRLLTLLSHLRKWEAEEGGTDSTHDILAEIISIARDQGASTKQI